MDCLSPWDLADRKTVKHFKNIILMTLMGLAIGGCSKRSIANLHDLVIDAGGFQVTVPSNFKLIKRKGLDSSVGSISNGKIEFRFDFGWYSNRGPLTYYDYVDKSLFNFHEAEVISTCQLSDSTSAKIKKNLIILDARRNPKYPSSSEKEISTTIAVRTGNCTIFLANREEKISQTYEMYEIQEVVNLDFRRKQFYPKRRNSKKAGVFIENLKEKREAEHGHSKLNFSTNDYREKNAELIIKILKSVKLKADHVSK